MPYSRPKLRVVLENTVLSIIGHVIAQGKLVAESTSATINGSLGNTLIINNGVIKRPRRIAFFSPRKRAMGFENIASSVNNQLAPVNKYMDLIPPPSSTVI
jgi:hypothetical protein